MDQTLQKAGVIAALLSVLVGALILLRFCKSRTKTRWTIGIMQTATHPALDDARKGFMESLQEKMGKDVSFVIRNGEGSSTQLHAIAQHFHTRPEIDAIYAIATPAVQAITLVEKIKPVIIAAVTDPKQLGIMTPTTQMSNLKQEMDAMTMLKKTGLDLPEANVTGTSDMINVEQEIVSMLTLLPSLKTVSIIYSPSEINATSVADKMKEILTRKGIVPRLVPLSTQAEVPIAVASALAKSDALLAPTDNIIASAITLIADLARKARKPLIVSDNTLVGKALMAQGVNYFQSGKESGRIAYEVLVNKKPPYEIPIEHARNTEVVINNRVLQELGLTIPSSLSDAHIVTGWRADELGAVA